MINSVLPKNKFKTIFSLVSFVFCANFSNSQNLNIYYKDGNKTSFDLELVRKITFGKDIMQLTLKDSTFFDLSLNNISKYEYSNNSLGIRDLPKIMNLLDITLFPNPVSNELYFRLNMIKESEITLLICDLNGNEIKKLKIEKQPVGIFQNKINLSDLSTGTYLFRLICEDEVISKKVILN